MNMVIRERMLAPLIDHQRDVIDALIESATNSDAKNYSDRKMFLEITQIYVPGKALLDKIRSDEPGFIANKTDEELERIISESTHEYDAESTRKFGTESTRKFGIESTDKFGKITAQSRTKSGIAIRDFCFKSGRAGGDWPVKPGCRRQYLADD